MFCFHSYAPALAFPRSKCSHVVVQTGTEPPRKLTQERRRRLWPLKDRHSNASLFLLYWSTFEMQPAGNRVRSSKAPYAFQPDGRPFRDHKWIQDLGQGAYHNYMSDVQHKMQEMAATEDRADDQHRSGLLDYLRGLWVSDGEEVTRRFTRMGLPACIDRDVLKQIQDGALLALEMRIERHFEEAGV